MSVVRGGKAGPAWAAVRHPRRAPADRDQHPHRHRQDQRGTRDRDRGPGFRRGPRRGTRTSRQPTQMASNAGLSVIVIDPASRWAAQYWLRPLREHHPKTTGHHAAALVIGRRGLGHRARRRATGTQTAPAEAARPAQARPRTPPAAGNAPRKPATPRGSRQPPGTKTSRPHRTTAGNQAAHNRSEPPATQDYMSCQLNRNGTVRPWRS